MSLLRFEPAASAAVKADEAMLPSPVVRREEEVAMDTDVPVLLGIKQRSLTSAERAQRLSRLHAAASLEDGTTTVQICGMPAVTDSCRVLRRNDDKTTPLLSTTLGQINQALGLCPNLDTVNWMMTNLELEEDITPAPDRAMARIGCVELCMAAWDYFNERQNEFALPISSDTTCWWNGDAMVCDIFVPPEIVSTQMGQNKYTGKSGDTMHAPANTPETAGEGLGHKSVANSNCPFAQEHAVLRLAQIFRFYPRKKHNDFVDTAIAMPKRNQIFQGLAEAEVWLSLTLRAMINFETRAEDAEYFGGKGPLSKNEVRAIVWRVLSYVLREYQDGLHISMPGGFCEPLVQGYVWTIRRETGDVVRPNRFGCDAELNGECGLDPKDDRYHVYICEEAFRQSEPDFVSLFVHEASHHAGPQDLSYDPDRVKRMTQAKQLDNADNYQRFLLAVVTDEVEASSRWKRFWNRVGDKFKKFGSNMREGWKKHRAKGKRRKANRKQKRAAKNANKKAKKASNKSQQDLQ